MTGDISPPASFIDPKDVLSRAEEQSTSQDLESTVSHTEATPASETSGTQKKKRKSWGQVLPEPTTNLPPRKRAKTTEEKAQRHYERVQRNRLAAHNSRMRKQDEMDRVVAENNSLKQDNQHQLEEIKRLQEELACLRSFQASNINGSNLACPLTPPMDYTQRFSETSGTSPEPSLTNGSSNDVSSPSELNDLVTPTSPQNIKEFPSENKQFNDSHSAEMCTQQWTLNSQSSSRAPTLADTT